MSSCTPCRPRLRREAEEMAGAGAADMDMADMGTADMAGATPSSIRHAAFHAGR